MSDSNQSLQAINFVCGLFIYTTMINIDLTKYKPFLVQKMKDGYAVRNSTEWGILIKSFPFDIYPEMKDIPKNDWFDEDGDEEFVPDVPVFKAYEAEVEFIYEGARDTGYTNVRSFLNYLATNGLNKIYDSYTSIGKQNVRYQKQSDAKLYRNSTKEYIIFKVNLKFNDPTTMITLSL